MIDPGKVLEIVEAFNRGEPFAYADLPVTVIEIRGVKINVVTPQTLYDMKKNTVRYKDKIDAYNLRERYDVKD